MKSCEKRNMNDKLICVNCDMCNKEESRCYHPLRMRFNCSGKFIGIPINLMGSCLVHPDIVDILTKE